MDKFIRTWISNESLIQKFSSGVIVEVGTPEQANIAEEAGAVAVVVREKYATNGNRMQAVARMPSPELLCAVKEAVMIPVIARCRAGHFPEAQILQYLGADGLEEFDDLTQAEESTHIWKHDFEIAFMCEASSLVEALARIGEGAVMLRTRSEVGAGNIATTIKQIRVLFHQLHDLRNAPEEELITYTKGIYTALELIEDIKQQGNLPVPIFASGGILTPADAALIMKLGMQGVFVEEEIFQTTKPDKRLAGIVRAARFPDCIDFIAELSQGL